MNYGQHFILNTSNTFESVMAEGNCCWNMSESEGSDATDVFFPGQVGRKPSIEKITSIKSYKCNASEDKIAQNSFTYGGINYHNNFIGNVYTLF